MKKRSGRVGEPGPGGERFLDNRRFEGAIPRIIRPVLDALQRNMKRRAVVRGAFREDLWEYPETAVREAVINAVGHRDLSSLARGAPVQIQMFPDRLIVINPGGLFGPVTVERLGDEGISSTRNQVLMRLLEDTPVPGEPRVVCENRGSGIGAMLAALRQASMTPPQFQDRISSFAVTFPNHTLLDEHTLRWMARLGAYWVNDNQRMALALMRRGETLTNSLYRRATGVDSRIATRELRQLVDQGWVLRVGTRGSASYSLAPAATHTPTLTRRGDHSENILQLIRERGPLSRATIVEALGIHDRTAQRWLRRLLAEGQITFTTKSARDPAARYRSTHNGEELRH